MHPALLFLLAILTPIVLCVSALVPAYAGIFGAVYVIYMPESGAHPLDAHMLDVFYIIESYSKLLDYWLANMSAVDLVEFTLPIVALPLTGFFLSLWLTLKIARRLLNLFYLSTDVN